MSYSTADKEWFDGKPRPTVFQHQADATLNQVNPVSGTKYTVLNTTNNARILSIAIVCTWTVQPTPLEVHVTIDGTQQLFSVDNPVSAGYYSAALRTYYTTNLLIPIATSDPLTTRTFLLEGRSAKIEAEITGGTVSNLSARVKYAKIP